MLKGIRIIYTFFFVISICITPVSEKILIDETTNNVPNPAAESKTIIENALEVFNCKIK